MVRKNSPRMTEIASVEFHEENYHHLRGLKDLPDALLEAHLKLYSGYIANVNKLLQRLAGTDSSGPEWAEMHRRLGFEMNGMRLHELYFENLTPGGHAASREIEDTLSEAWSSAAAWE